MPTLTKTNLTSAADYYFRKATFIVKYFVKESQYSKISREKDGKLTYTRRILPTNSSAISGPMTKAMQNLSATTFCISLVDKHSPIAYAIINEVHWHDNVAQNADLETVCIYALRRANIIEGKSIAKTIKRYSRRCRYVRKKAIDIAMGPVFECHVKIVPTFYSTKVDLAGPFKACFRRSKRTALKIGLVVLCCATTCTINIRFIEDYSLTSVIHAFIRFACKVDYPKKLLPDEGSRLIKRCSTMKLDIREIKSRLQSNFNFELKACPSTGVICIEKLEERFKK